MQCDWSVWWKQRGVLAFIFRLFSTFFFLFFISLFKVVIILFHARYFVCRIVWMVVWDSLLSSCLFRHNGWSSQWIYCGVVFSDMAEDHRSFRLNWSCVKTRRTHSPCTILITIFYEKSTTIWIKYRRFPHIDPAIPNRFACGSAVDVRWI